MYFRCPTHVIFCVMAVAALWTLTSMSVQLVPKFISKRVPTLNQHHPALKRKGSNFRRVLVNRLGPSSAPRYINTFSQFELVSVRSVPSGWVKFRHYLDGTMNSWPCDSQNRSVWKLSEISEVESMSGTWRKKCRPKINCESAAKHTQVRELNKKSKRTFKLEIKKKPSVD